MPRNQTIDHHPPMTLFECHRQRARADQDINVSVVDQRKETVIDLQSVKHQQIVSV